MEIPRGWQRSVAKTTEDIVRTEIKNLLRDDCPDNFDDIPLAELGVDSLEFFEVLMILEDDYGIILPVDELHSSISLKDIIDALN
ncbi:MAG: acyl carrier protein [Proteobacteria bacterium]|nr:MAG: acyl carrier protein [Pseudomonadota bacterium]